jgi:hypothetical protein
MSVQTKKKAPLDLAISPPTAAPLMWTTGTNNPKSDPTIRDKGKQNVDEVANWLADPDKVKYPPLIKQTKLAFLTVWNIAMD